MWSGAGLRRSWQLMIGSYIDPCIVPRQIELSGVFLGDADVREGWAQELSARVWELCWGGQLVPHHVQ